MTKAIYTQHCALSTANAGLSASYSIHMHTLGLGLGRFGKAKVWTGRQFVTARMRVTMWKTSTKKKE